MKKLISILLCLGLCATLFAGCTNPEEALIQKRYTADGTQIKALHIAVHDRGIVITPSEDNQIHIDYGETSKESFDFTVSDQQTLTMTAVDTKDWSDYFGIKASADARKIAIQLPTALLDALQVATTNGTISIPAPTAVGSVSLSSEGGDIDFQQLDVKNSIQLNAKNGKISGALLGSYEDYVISCEIKKGKSNLPASKEGGTKALSVSNNNGDIDIAFVKE